MYFNYYRPNEPIDDLNVNNQLKKDKNSEEYYEFDEPLEDVYTSMDSGFRFNNLESKDDFMEFIPYYSCPFFRQQHNPPPRPPYGPPGGQPGMPPGGHGGNQGMPSGPPPGYTPSKPQESHMHGGAQPMAVDPGAIMPCRFRFAYIWLKSNDSFWAYITHVGRNSIAGFRWNGRRWNYFGMDLRRIESFTCH